MNIYGKPIDLRIATFPTIFGENVVLRILNKEQLIIGLENLGFSPANQTRFNRAMSIPTESFWSQDRQVPAKRPRCTLP